MNFIDTRHVAYCGWVAGLAEHHGLHVDAGRDENDEYTARLRICFGGRHIDVIVPYPPDDWEPSA